MNNLDSQTRQQESLKRRWQERRLSTIDQNQNQHQPAAFYNRKQLVAPSSLNPSTNNNCFRPFPGCLDDDLVSTVVPPVTVVLEGRSICQRISLHKHASYQSLAKALRQMFVDAGSEAAAASPESEDLDLSNAVPGHLVAYEDIENDLLLAGDLNWKDFVRVAKRIRILPVKRNSRKGREEV